MDEQNFDVWIAALVLCLWPASIVTWVALLVRRSQRGEFLPYEPRKPVPWGMPVALLTVLFVAVTFLAGLTGDTDVRESSGDHVAESEFETTAPPLDKLDVSEAIPRLAGFIVFQTLIVGGVLAAVAAIYNTSWRDLGLPSSFGEFGRDVWIGVVAFLAALAPVQGIQAAMLWLFGMTEEAPGHPLIEMVTAGGPNLTLLLLASAAAIAVAPFTEEILFRLLLQGWLEKWEDVRTGRYVGPDSGANPSVESGELLEGVLTPIPDSSMPAADTARHTEQVLASELPPDVQLPLQTAVSDMSPGAGFASLPRGWFPILCSASLFAIAHFGYGPDPIPLFFLALILGYVYQRTHRILPCMVTHALFNSVAIFVLWRMVFANAK